MSECLEENEIVDFVMGNLEPEEAARAEAHVDECAGCRAVLIELARVFELRASSLPEPEAQSHDETETSDPVGLGLLPPELLKGSKLGRYVMLDMLGTGAMGVVFSAYDPELDRKVAVKLMRDRTGDSDRNGRMVREARATARLAHPNVVVVHDVGEFEGNVFMAMELVLGGTLGDWLDAERTRDEILGAFIEAGEGLSAAHDAGLVHRDFKPANVLMGENGRPRVTDFGLARAGESADTTTQDDLISLSGSADVAVTKTGALVGTPAYMSPEQFEGKVADALSDQFSFCVALAEALTKERPFEGRTLMELQASVCTGRVRSGALDGLPRPLQSALARGLACEPSKRFGDMRALLRVLSNVRRGSSAKGWTRATLLGVAVLGGAGAAWAGASARSQPTQFGTCRADAERVGDLWTDARRRELEASIAEIDRPAAPRIARSVVDSLDDYTASWMHAHDGACVSDEELSVQFSTLRCLERGRVELSALLVALEHAEPVVLEHAEEAVRGLPAPEACGTAQWHDDTRPEPPEAIRAQVEAQTEAYEVARALHATGQYALAEAHMGTVLTAMESIDYPPLALDAAVERADTLSELGRTDEARTLLRDAWADAIRANQVRSQVRIASEMVDTFASGAKERDREAAAFWLDVAEAALSRISPDDPAAWEFWSVAGKYHAYSGSMDEAQRALERALSVESISYSQQLSSRSGLLSVKSQRAKAGEQEALMEEGRALIDSLRQTLGPDHPRLVTLSQPYSNALAQLGRGEEAVAALNDALRIADDVYAPDDTRIAGLLSTLSQAQSVAGDLEGARASSARVVALREASESDDITLALAYNNLAVADLSLGDYEASTKNLERAVPLMESGFGPEHINLANALTTLSSNLIELERLDEARTHLERATAIAKAFGPGSARLDPIIALNLAKVDLTQGRLDATASGVTEGIALAKGTYGDTHPLLAKFHATAARVALAKGDAAAANLALDRATALANDEKTKAALRSLRDRAEALAGG